MLKEKSVFSNKNFVLLFQGALTSNIAATFYSFALSFYILKITNNNALIQGVYLAVCGITFVVFSFVGGVLADRWNKAKIIYMSDFIKGALIILAALPMYIFVRSNSANMQLVIIFIIGIINNIIAAIFSPATLALIPELVEEDKLQQANSYFSILNSFVSIVGIILAGIIYSYVPITILFIIVGFLYVLSGLSELFIKVVYVKKEDSFSTKLVIKEFLEGLNILWSLKPILYIIIGSLFLNFFFTPFSSNLLPYIINTDISVSNYYLKQYIVPEMWLSIFSALFSVGSLIMAFIVGKQQQKEKQGKAIKLNLFIVSIVTILMATSYYLFIENYINIFLIVFAVAIFIVGVALVGVNVPINVATQKNIPEGMLAKVSSVMNIGSMGLTPFASLLGGIVITYFGSGTLFIIIALGLSVVTAFILFSKEISKI